MDNGIFLTIQVQGVSVCTWVLNIILAIFHQNNSLFITKPVTEVVINSGGKTVLLVYSWLFCSRRIFAVGLLTTKISWQWGRARLPIIGGTDISYKARDSSLLVTCTLSMCCHYVCDINTAVYVHYSIRKICYRKILAQQVYLIFNNNLVSRWWNKTGHILQLLEINGIGQLVMT